MHVKICNTPSLGLILESQVDIGLDTDFAMYHSVYLNDLCSTNTPS